jgi:hypothetical protein
VKRADLELYLRLFACLLRSGRLSLLFPGSPAPCVIEAVPNFPPPNVSNKTVALLGLMRETLQHYVSKITLYRALAPLADEAYRDDGSPVEEFTFDDYAQSIGCHPVVLDADGTEKKLQKFFLHMARRSGADPLVPLLDDGTVELEVQETPHGKELIVRNRDEDPHAETRIAIRPELQGSPLELFRASVHMDAEALCSNEVVIDVASMIEIELFCRLNASGLLDEEGFERNESVLWHLQEGTDSQRASWLRLIVGTAKVERAPYELLHGISFAAKPIVEGEVNTGSFHDVVDEFVQLQDGYSVVDGEIGRSVVILPTVFSVLALARPDLLLGALRQRPDGVALYAGWRPDIVLNSPTPTELHAALVAFRDESGVRPGSCVFLEMVPVGQDPSKGALGSISRTQRCCARVPDRDLSTEHMLLLVETRTSLSDGLRRLAAEVLTTPPEKEGIHALLAQFGGTPDLDVCLKFFARAGSGEYFPLPENPLVHYLREIGHLPFDPRRSTVHLKIAETAMAIPEIVSLK